MGGYKYSRDPGLDPRPTSLQGVNARRTAINQEVWSELGSEGSAASINTYDNQGAILTWGRGFAAKGELREAMARLFAADPAVRNLLLDAGFTLKDGEWLAVDVSTGEVATGDNALNLVRWNTAILSRLIDIAEDPAHAQKWVDAQAATAMQNAGAVPAAAERWPDDVIRFVAHCVHWGVLTWPDAVGTGGDLKAIIHLQSQHVHITDPWLGGSRLVASQPTRDVAEHGRRRRPRCPGPGASSTDGGRCKQDDVERPHLLRRGQQSVLRLGARRAWGGPAAPTVAVRSEVRRRSRIYARSAPNLLGLHRWSGRSPAFALRVARNRAGMVIQTHMFEVGEIRVRTPRPL